MKTTSLVVLLIVSFQITGWSQESKTNQMLTTGQHVIVSSWKEVDATLGKTVTVIGEARSGKWGRVYVSPHFEVAVYGVGPYWSTNWAGFEYPFMQHGHYSALGQQVKVTGEIIKPGYYFETNCQIEVINPKPMVELKESKNTNSVPRDESHILPQ